MARLAGAVDVAFVARVSSREDGAAVAARLSAEDVDAVLIFQAMAVMPAYAAAALSDRVPVVVWSVQREARLPLDFDHAGIVREGSIVGTPMLTSVLVREHRPFDLAIGRPDDPATVQRVIGALRSASAARRIRRARIGIVGSPIDGYDCVALDPLRVHEKLGLTIVPIEPAEVLELWSAVSADRISTLESETRAIFQIDADVEGDVLAWTLRAACAIEDLVARHRLDAGVMNCHVPEIRFGAEIGIAPCFGLGRMTSAGVPWSCSGDGLTAIAMLTLKALGGAAQYHELEAFDAASGEFVVACTGEHDLAFGDSRVPRLQRNGWYAGDPRCGACANFGAPPGPATLLAFAELDPPAADYRFIVASGEFTERGFPAVGTANAAFRFAGGDAATAWASWCRGGANHHSAATPGEYAPSIAAVALHLGIQCATL